MTLGENISKLMKEKGVTGKELAQKLQTSESYISEIKNDRQDPSLRKLRDIAAVLETETYELLKTYRISHESNCRVAEENYND
jgi:transcriptional regulator with XRE-family HTH domain